MFFFGVFTIVHGFLCRKQTCTVTVIHYWSLDGPPSVDSTSSSRHRSIARYRPTIAFIAARRRSVHSMRISQILAENPDFCLPHLHSTFPSEYCHAVWYGKLEWLDYPTVKTISKISLFISTEFTIVTDTRTDGQTPHDGIGRAYA